MLAMWMYFWNRPDWVAGPSPTPTPSPAPIPISSGGARGRGYKPKVDPWLEPTRVPTDFWETRERYLRRFVAPIVASQQIELPVEKQAPAPKSEIAPEKLLLAATEHSRNTLLLRAQRARTVEELRKVSTKIINLTLDIRKISVQYYEQAAIILLLDLF